MEGIQTGEENRVVVGSGAQGYIRECGGALLFYGSYNNEKERKI